MDDKYQSILTGIGIGIYRYIHFIYRLFVCKVLKIKRQANNKDRQSKITYCNKKKCSVHKECNHKHTHKSIFTFFSHFLPHNFFVSIFFIIIFIIISYLYYLYIYIYIYYNYYYYYILQHDIQISLFGVDQQIIKSSLFKKINIIIITIKKY